MAMEIAAVVVLVVCLLPVCRYAELKLLETKTHYGRPKSLGDATSKPTRQRRWQKVLKYKSAKKDDEDETISKSVDGSAEFIEM